MPTTGYIPDTLLRCYHFVDDKLKLGFEPQNL